jgi:hypothetical protein
MFGLIPYRDLVIARGQPSPYWASIVPVTHDILSVNLPNSGEEFRDYLSIHRDEDSCLASLQVWRMGYIGNWRINGRMNARAARKDGDKSE